MEELTLQNFLDIIKKRIIYIIAISIFAALCGFALSKYIMPPKYSSYIDAYITIAANASDSDFVNTNNISTAQKLTNTYMVILQTDEVVSRLLKSTDLSDKYTISELLEMVSFSAVNSTEVMRITATTPSAELSAKICNGYAKLAPVVMEEIVGGGSVKILSYAKVSSKQSEPDVNQYVKTGFLIGVVISTAFFVYIRLVDSTIKNEQEIADRTGFAVVGAVPDFFSVRGLKIPKQIKRDNRKISRSKAQNKRKIFSQYTLLNKNSPFQITEAYNMIRTNLMFSLSSSTSGSIVITSGAPNEFKSTTAANLAISTAIAGAKVLLIDADMRGASLHRMLKKPNGKGLSRVLAELDTFEESVIKGIYPRVDFLPAGPTPPNPSELLGTVRAAELLKSLDSKYDFIIIDSPPMNIVADAMLLTSADAGVLLVARSYKTKHAELAHSIKNIKNTKANFLGIVLTDIKPGESSYGGYGYEYGHKEQ